MRLTDEDVKEIKCRRGYMRYYLNQNEAAILMNFKGIDYRVIVDKETIDKIKSFGHKWSFRTIKNGIPKYIGTTIRDDNGNLVNISFHRWILNAPNDVYIDHINMNTLDNRLCNLRTALPHENKQNMRQYKISKTGIRGVRQGNTPNSWRATVKVKGKYVFDKTYKTKVEATKAVKQARKIYMPFSEDCREVVTL